MFAHNPLHGSGQAGFPHPALALGEDAHAAQGIGMTYGRRRQPASDIHSTYRLRSVRSSLQPFSKFLEIHLQLLAVVSPRLPVHAWRGFLLQRAVSHAQCFQIVDVVQVSDRAGLWHTSRYRCTRWGLPLSPTASASRRKELTRLNTWPARSPVNASTLLLRTAPHDSGPMWVAISHSYDFCIHYTSPV
jgi:hypothetical protein